MPFVLLLPDNKTPAKIPSLAQQLKKKSIGSLPSFTSGHPAEESSLSPPSKALGSLSFLIPVLATVHYQKQQKL